MSVNAIGTQAAADLALNPPLPTGKLNAGGMTFLDTDVIRILEADLPARFGGGPTDYQLLEEERGDGRPRVVLVVRPEGGPLDSAAVAAWFLGRLGRGSGAERIMALT